MKLPDITMDDLVKSVNRKEQISVWVLMQFFENGELSVDEEKFKEACVSSMCQSIMTRLLDYAMENENLKKLVEILIKASKIVYQEKFGEYFEKDMVASDEQ